MMFVSGYVGPSFFHPLNPGSALSALFFVRRAFAPALAQVMQ
jgi:hypothetical protein